MVSGLQRAVPLVESDDVLHTFKGAPGRPRRALGQLVTQRGSIEGVGGQRVRVERSSVEHITLPLWPGTHQHVIVKVRFAVTVESVSEADDVFPSGRPVAF